MSQDRRLPALHILLAHALVAAVFALLILAKPVLLRGFEYPGGDAPRYVVAGMDLLDYGLFSGSAAGETKERFKLVEGGPLVAFELAATFALSPETKSTMRCVLREQLNTCALNLRGLYAVHWLELVVFCVCAWIAGWMIFRRLDAAWLTFLAVVFCRELRETTGQALTEPLSYAVSGLFFLSWIYAWRNSRWPAWLLAGIALGLLILAKPAATAIIPTTIILLAVMLIVKREGNTHLQGSAVNAATFVAGAVAMMLPLMLRNYIELGVFALSLPNYFTATFAHRIAYNAMSWTEWLTGWLFYLPDFGDSLARKWLPEATYDRLGWDPQSYYVYGRDVLHRQALLAAGDAANSYLIREYVLAEPVKHAAATLLLAWRGMFVGKLWGLIAFLLLPAALIGAKQQRMMLVLMLAPAVVVLFGQAALSVSIQRYNGLLVLPLALTTTALVVMLWDRWRPHRKAGSRQP